MLSTKQAKLAIKVLSLLLIAALSFFVATEKIPETNFVKESLESIEESNGVIMRFSAATLSTSLAISLLPDDVGAPLADSLADMNVYFISLLAILLLEKILIIYGVKLAFLCLIPCACIAGALSMLLKRGALKGLAARLLILGLTVALVVPCSTHITEHVAADLTTYVEDTINETESGADKLNEAVTSDSEGQTVFEKISELFQKAINGISDLMLYFRNTIRRCMNSIAILFLTNFIMPVLTFLILKWILKETFNIIIPVPPMRKCSEDERESKSELAAAGGGTHEK